MEENASAQKRFGSALFWRLFVLINLVTVAWVGWVIWQLIPHPAVNDFVLRLPVSQRSASGSIPAVSPPAPSGVVTVVPVAAPVPVEEIPMQSGPPMTPLRLETQIRTPPKLNDPVTRSK